MLPFFLFSGMFLIGLVILAYRSLEAPDGSLTLDNYRALTDANVLAAYGMSIRLSLLTAVVGGVFGFLLAWASPWAVWGVRPVPDLAAFSGVASNFAGVPLAAAFVFTLGRVGVITDLLAWMGVDLYDTGFSLYSFWGLAFVYLFPVPPHAPGNAPCDRWPETGLARGR